MTKPPQTEGEISPPRLNTEEGEDSLFTCHVPITEMEALVSNTIVFLFYCHTNLKLKSASPERAESACCGVDVGGVGQDYTN